MKPGVGLAGSTAQAEFHFENVTGSIVGFWFPSCAAALNVVGLASSFRSTTIGWGGHLLDLGAEDLTIQSTDHGGPARLALQETKEFMQANAGL